MALPKTFTAGERLFAEDLNEALEYLDGETLALNDEVVAVKATADAAIPAPNSPSDNQILTYDSATSAWTAETPPPSGKILQVVTVTDTSNRSTSSTSFVDASISASITPVSSNSLLLLTWTFTMSVTSGQGEEGTETAYYRITLANNTPISGTNGAAHFEEQNGQYSSSGSMGIVRAVVSPAGSGARTYKGQFRHGGGLTTGINNADAMGVFTIMEIAA